MQRPVPAAIGHQNVVIFTIQRSATAHGRVKVTICESVNRQRNRIVVILFLALELGVRNPPRPLDLAAGRIELPYARFTSYVVLVQDSGCLSERNHKTPQSESAYVSMLRAK